MPRDANESPNESAILTAVSTVSPLATAAGVVTLTDNNISNLPDVIVPTNTSYSPDASSNFAARYLTLDTFDAEDDGTDLGYMRVLRFNNGKFGSQVFPINNINGINSQPRYQNFIVTSLGSGMIEKAQILKTSGTTQIYGFDSQVEVLTLQGVLRSTKSDNWDMAMVFLWDELLRLTKLVQQNLIVEFGYQSNIYWGYPLNFNWQKSSNMQYIVSYSMQFVVIKRSLLAKSILQQTLFNDLNTQMQNIASII